MHILLILILCLQKFSCIRCEKFCTVVNKFGTYNMRYYHHETQNPKESAALVCVHGFGGNADQFRKNLPILSEKGHDTYAVDLLGYGYSDKPNPKLYRTNEFYNFDTWTEQMVHFVEQTVRKPSVLVCNSVGGLVGLQAAIAKPDLIKGVVLINMSLRMLHVKKQKRYLRPFLSGLQTLLRETRLGKLFFNQVLNAAVQFFVYLLHTLGKRLKHHVLIPDVCGRYSLLRCCVQF